jgi:hypothetical protein
MSERGERAGELGAEVDKAPELVLTAGGLDNVDISFGPGN